MNEVDYELQTWAEYDEYLCQEEWPTEEEWWEEQEKDLTWTQYWETIDD